jgi:Ca-activated chloride channel family protein
MKAFCTSVVIAILFLLAGCSLQKDDAATHKSEEVQVTAQRAPALEEVRIGVQRPQKLGMQVQPASIPYPAPPPEQRERYQHISENPLKNTAQDSVSTLSLDVDTGSYSNIRRFIQGGQLPPKDAVRVEELINYFSYAYAQPKAGAAHPFIVNTEVATAPWNPDHLLMRVGIKAVEQEAAAMPPANLVFLVDVSGSMNEANKLPLVKASLKLLVEQLRPQDRVALIVYAGRTAMELPATPGNEKEKILAAIERLNAGGSTAGESALRMAYTEARANYIKKGINRILLATDGDFNVGVSDTEQLVGLVERERADGITLTTLGYGTGNYNEAMMERIADAGNGNYGYIDSLAEAKKVLVDELSSTFMTVAKDVKVQIEFNPAQIAEWRLIGYENRVLREEDFKNDKIDAGEVGAGKSVTALYELTPVGKPTLTGGRRYGKKDAEADSRNTHELAEVRVRYKQPDGDHSIELRSIVAGSAETIVGKDANGSGDLRFAAAVAAFGQRLKGGTYLNDFGYKQIAQLASGSLGSDEAGYRRNFVDLVQLAGALEPGTQ